MVFRDRSYAVLIVSAGEKFNTATGALLPVNEYWPVRTCGSVSEARRVMLEQSFDIVIINTPLPDDFGVDLAIDICDDTDTGVLLFVKNEIYDDIYYKVVEHGVFCISKPTSSQLVSQNLRVMCAARERLRMQEARRATVEEKIEEIRLVNRAKWLLIENLSMTEDQAQHFIEKEAMDSRTGKRSVAEGIIKSYGGG